jgi:hypothetical protein
MKFRITLKDPDGVLDSIDDAVQCIQDIMDIKDKDEVDVIREHRKDKYLQLCKTWFEYDEYLTVEIDTEAKTCTVIPVGKYVTKTEG